MEGIVSIITSALIMATKLLYLAPVVSTVSYIMYYDYVVISFISHSLVFLLACVTPHQICCILNVTIKFVRQEMNESFSKHVFTSILIAECSK